MRAGEDGSHAPSRERAFPDGVRPRHVHPQPPVRSDAPIEEEGDMSDLELTVRRRCDESPKGVALDQIVKSSGVGLSEITAVDTFRRVSTIGCRPGTSRATLAAGRS